MKRSLKIVAVTLALTALSASAAFASGWQKNDRGWWYGTNADNSSWHANGWQWVDGNGDGVAECYYFDANGYCLMNTTTPDGYKVNSNGAWLVNGAVQTKKTGSNVAAVATVASTKQYTDQFKTKNGVVYYGNKQIEDIRAYGAIEDMGSYYSVKNATIMYLGINSYGDPGSTPLAENLELRVNKNANIAYNNFIDGIQNMTAESFKNAYTYFTPTLNETYYDGATVVLFAEEFDSTGAITKASIHDFG